MLTPTLIVPSITVTLTLVKKLKRIAKSSRATQPLDSTPRKLSNKRRLFDRETLVLSIESAKAPYKETR